MMKKYSFITILAAIYFCVLGKTKSCSGNWKLLDGSPWNVTVTSTKYYQISLCRPLKYDSLPGSNCNGSAICLFEGGTARSLANLSSFKDVISGNFLKLEGSPCTNSMFSSVFFHCSDHLNFPELVLESDCSASFKWDTLAACTGPIKRKEVQCHINDPSGKIKDLTPLIKKKGSYPVLTTDTAVEFFINVCSDIVPDDEIEEYPSGASAWRKIGKEILPFGRPNTAVFSSGSDVKIVYDSINTTIPAGCDMPPRTTVTFRCPQKGKSRHPQVIANSNCQYEIEWQTEHSCPLDTIVTDLKSCKFTREQHGVELDLSPLRKSGGYHLMQTISNHTFYFNLNVCGRLGEQRMCRGWQSSSVCLDNTTIGAMRGATLRYLDGKVELIYFSSTMCKDRNNTKTKTIIEFYCDENAEKNGEGSPKFVEVEDCVYFFKWNTKYACPTQPLVDNCYIDHENIHINLEPLIKSPDGKPWQVVNTLERTSDTYYLNVCGDIPKNFNGSHCEAGAGVCRSSSNGSSVNYGMFTSPPTYNKRFKTVHMNYTNGDSCGSGQRETRINFICKPGLLDTPPVLERISDDNCQLTIRWHTAAACPQGEMKGSDCKVYDEDLGILFDLNPLRKDTYYEVKAKNYTYYLNVCDKVNGTRCDVTAGSLNAAVCQEGTTAIKLGEPNTELLYIDGMINLTYTLGTPINNKPRTTSITFLCDDSAGIGHPELLEEAHYAYSFRWYTSYACPKNAAVECFVRNPHTNQQYDLSRLTKTRGNPNWILSGGPGHEDKIFYINICGPLTSAETNCSSHSSACLVEVGKSEGSRVITNIGEMAQPPQIKGKGFLVLEYTNGDPCVSYGVSTTYKTLIHFLCSEDGTEHLVYNGKVGNCEYSFLWQTSAACPVEEVISENDCTIQDQLSGFTYDFTHLRTKYYNVTAGARKFQVNICGAVSGGCQGSNEANSVTACEIDEKGNLKKVIGTLKGYSLQLSEDRVVTLVYNGTYNQSAGAMSKVYITFKCNKLGENSNLVFKEEVNALEYYFELSTPAACSSEWTDCIFSDDFGKKYDLTPLMKRGSNWEVVDSREAHFDLRYHINFCLPLNPTEDYTCPAGTVGACQTSTLNNVGFILGHVRQRPVVGNGKVVIVYSGGTPCHGGKFNRSAVITLHCSEKQSEPAFLFESLECGYYFSMNTPAACPLEEHYGNNCTIMIPKFGYYFDLRSLHQVTGRYQVKHAEYEYILNICGAITNPPPNCIGAGVCQTKPGENFAINAGKASSKLRYNNGIIQLVYESGKGNCHGKYSRSTVISFICSTENPGPRFLSEDKDCTYYFEWLTSLVCHERELQECSVSSKTKHYDLSSMSSFPYEISLPQNRHVVLTVCRSLPSNRYGHACSRNSAACIVELNKNGSVTQSTNIGTLSSPYLENGVLKLKYTFGDSCEFFNETRKLATIIEFQCDKESWNTLPQFVENENCTYYFVWRHRAACPTETKVNGTCTAVNPVTGFVFDLSPLKHQTFYRVKTSNKEFAINVCGPVRNTTCIQESAACAQEGDDPRKRNIGVYNSKFHMYGSRLYLEYSSGDPCHGGLDIAGTILDFTCGIGNGHPVYEFQQYDCMYYFTWSTVYACEDRVRCVVENGSEIIDLSSLSLETGYHTAVDVRTNDKYFINVCGPINQISPLCQDAGVCHQIGNTSVSLGRPHGPPFIDFVGHITVIYTDGSPCDGNQTFTSRIIFSCDPGAGKGEPVLSIKDKCHYAFDWETSLVCPESVSPSLTSDCKFIDANRDISFDLSLLKRVNSSYEVKGKRDDDKFTLNVCGPADAGSGICSNAGVCFHGMAADEDFGSLSSTTVSYSGGELTLTYDDGGSCPLSDTGKRTSRILFTCDEKAGRGYPVLFKQSSCIAVFKWKTNVICENKPPECTFWLNNKFYDLRLLSSITHSWNISDSNGNTYWLNVCRATNMDFVVGNCLNSGVCMKHSNGVFSSLGTLESWKLDSDDSGEISLTYEHGDNKVCSEGNSAVSNIKFICGKTTGQPQFISGPSSSCTFNFVWKTSLACAEVGIEFLPMDKYKIFDSKLGYPFDMSPIFNTTFSIEWSGSDSYVYVINLNGVKLITTGNDCENAAVCQTKPGSFYRDIGTVSTEKFYLKGNELQLVLTSHGRRCGKNKNRNVTTTFYFICVSEAGVGTPSFYYESGDCDYLFHWETSLVCPRSNLKPDGQGDVAPKDKVEIKQVDKSSASYAIQVTIAIILSASLVALIIFIVSKEERRNAIRRKLNIAFVHIHLPRLCYRRGNSETLLLSSPSMVHSHDESDVEILS